MRLLRSAHFVETATRRRLAPQGMEIGELEILATIQRAGGPVTMGALQETIQLTSGAITNRITHLEDAGYVRRSIGRTDRRQVDVELTATGEDRLAAVIAAIDEAERDVFAGIPAELLRRIADDLREVLLLMEGSAETPS